MKKFSAAGILVAASAAVAMVGLGAPAFGNAGSVARSMHPALTGHVLRTATDPGSASATPTPNVTMTPVATPSSTSTPNMCDGDHDSDDTNCGSSNGGGSGGGSGSGNGHHHTQHHTQHHTHHHTESHGTESGHCHPGLGGLLDCVTDDVFSFLF